MNTPRILLFLVLTAVGICAQAQDNPAVAPAPAQTEMQKWIATTDAQWQAAFNRDVVDVHAADLKKLALHYAASLDVAVAKASASGDLEGVVALRNERKRFDETQVFPEQDGDADAASVKTIRAATRIQLARIETENAARTKALHAKYDVVLAQAQMQLTQAKRIDDALLVKAKREEIAAAWITPAVAAETAQASTPPPAPAQPAFPEKVAAKQPSASAKDAAKKGDVSKALVGRWHFHWTETGFEADYSFRGDGTYTETPSGHKGTWKIADDKVLMEQPGTAPKTMALPLIPDGTGVIDQRKNRHIIAVKKSG